MADGTFLPPWLTRDYDPVGTFMRAYQTGAQISEAQTRLAEQQRQANMEAQARQEQLQATMLRAMTETAVQKEYQQQQIALRQQDLAQEKMRADALAKQAADSLAERIAHDQAMEQLRQAEVMRPSMPEEVEVGGIPLLYSPKTGRFERKEKDVVTPQEKGQEYLNKLELTRTDKALAAARAKETDPNLSAAEKPTPEQIRELENLYAQRAGALTNAPALPFTPPKSTNEVIRVTKDGRRAVFDADTKKFLRYAD